MPLDKVAVTVGMDEKIWKKFESTKRIESDGEAEKREREREKRGGTVKRKATLLGGHALEFCAEKLMTITEESNPKVRE